MTDDTGTGGGDSAAIGERMQHLRERHQSLTIPGLSAGIYYDVDDPFDVELRVEFNDGSAVSNVIVPLEEAHVEALRRQVADVRERQRRAIGLAEPELRQWQPAGKVHDTDTDVSLPDAVSNQSLSEGAFGDEHSAGEDGPDSTGKVRRGLERASDPMGFGQLIKAVPLSDNHAARGLIVIGGIFVLFMLITFTYSMVH